MFSTLKSIFNIDDVRNKWGVRILYLLTVVFNAAIQFNPWADTDFSPLENWVMSFYDIAEYDPEAALNIPISQGNMIYLLTLTLGYVVLLTAAYIYAGVFVREYRKERVSASKKNGDTVIDYAVSRLPDQPIKKSELLMRILLLVLVSIVLTLPIASIFFYFMFITLMGIPFVFTAPVAYLSGDTNIFKAIPYSVRLSKRYYLTNVKSIALILVVILLPASPVPPSEEIGRCCTWQFDNLSYPALPVGTQRKSFSFH